MTRHRVNRTYVAVSSFDPSPRIGLTNSRQENLAKSLAAEAIRRIPCSRMKQNIGVDDQRHRLLFHDRFKGFSIGQIDSGRPISKAGRLSDCSDFGDVLAARPSCYEFIDPFSHRASLGSGEMLLAERLQHLSVFDSSRQKSDQHRHLDDVIRFAEQQGQLTQINHKICL